MNARTLPYVFNAILAILVGILYFLHFKSAPKQTAQVKTAEGKDTVITVREVEAEGNAKVLYINVDTLMDKYAWFKSQKASLAKQETAADNKLKAKGKALQDEIIAYQKKMQAGELTQQQAEATEKLLTEKQQAYLTEQEALTKQLMDKGAKAQEQLMKNLKKHLKNYLNAYQADYIMGYSEASDILIANEKLDITQDILKQLNAK